MIGFVGSTIGNTAPTLIDLASRMTKEGNIDVIVEMLAETNEIIQDMPWIEANDGTTHKTTIRSGLPNTEWRLLNYGVQPSKSTTVQVKDSTGMLEAYAEVDKALADLNNNAPEFRLSEDRAFIESMNQNFAETLIYGNVGATPERFHGIIPRYSQKSAENGDNIIDAGGTGSDNTSIILVVWGANTIHGIYPKGSTAGLKHQDLGEHTLIDQNGGKYQGYRSHYKWDPGLTLRDWRYVVRIANVDVSELTKNAAAGADLVDLMVQAIELIPNIGLGKPVFYCNRTIRSFLRRQITNKENVHLSMSEVAGKKVVQFDDIPVRKVDAILNTEARVV
ncbi:major capsid protein [Herminiimonas contaminans]|uniref:Phage protein n=1 Tax=Herminiimonas contaminans TaxID=1111140 RepID=A0ABS0EVF3_9BURK|nr:hypothetical protein [Herminiimonas contaminans]MBF8177812.1 hypothetical protein [Herminiimonas contaminans]